MRHLVRRWCPPRPVSHRPNRGRHLDWNREPENTTLRLRRQLRRRRPIRPARDDRRDGRGGGRRDGGGGGRDGVRAVRRCPRRHFRRPTSGGDDVCGRKDRRDDVETPPAWPACWTKFGNKNK